MHGPLTWRTFRLSLVAFALACGHAAAAAKRPGVSTYNGANAVVRPGPASRPGQQPGAPARFVGVGPTVIAAAGDNVRFSLPMGASSGIVHAATREGQATRPARRAPEPAPQAKARPAQAAAPPAPDESQADRAADQRRRSEHAQTLAAAPPAPQPQAAQPPPAQPPAAPRLTRRASVVTAALSRRPSGPALMRDPFGPAPSLAMGR